MPLGPSTPICLPAAGYPAQAVRIIKVLRMLRLVKLVKMSRSSLLLHVSRLGCYCRYNQGRAAAVVQKEGEVLFYSRCEAVCADGLTHILFCRMQCVRS